MAGATVGGALGHAWLRVKAHVTGAELKCLKEINQRRRRREVLADGSTPIAWNIITSLAGGKSTLTWLSTYSGVSPITPTRSQRFPGQFDAQAKSPRFSKYVLSVNTYTGDGGVF